MKANELRIGNLVQYPNYNNDGTVKYFKIRDIYTDDDKISLTDGMYQLPSSNLKYIKSISLTEEWLVKFGLKEIELGYYYLTDDVIVSIEGHCYAESGHDGSRTWIAEIHFVHQLQNLYFALTGKELEVKP